MAGESENILLRFILTAEDTLSPVMATAGGKMQTLAETGRTAFLAIGAVMGGVAFEAVRMAESFDQSMRKVAALADGTTKNLDAMKASVLELSLRVPKSAVDLGNALYYVVSAGFSGADAMKVLEAAAKAATSGLTDTKIVADAVTSVLNAYKLGAGAAGDVTGKLVAAVTAGKTEVGDLAGALGRVLPLAAAAGVNFDQVAASMATMTRTGLNASEAATALRGAIAGLEVPHTKARDVIEKLGMTVDEVRKGMLTNYMGTLELLLQKTGGNLEMLSALFPNIRAFTGVLATAGSQGKAYADILDSISKAGAAANDNAFGITMQGMGPQVELLKNQLSAMAIQLGEKLLPYVIEAAKWVRELAIRFEEWVKQNPELAKFAAIAVGVAAGISAISLVVGPLVALLTGPLGLVVALAAIGTQVVDVKKVFDTNFPAIQEKAKTVTDNIGSFLGGLKKSFEDQTTKTLPEYADAYDKLTSRVNPFRESIAKVTEGLPPLINEMDKSNKKSREYFQAVADAHAETTKWEDRGRKLGDALGWLWKKVLEPIATFLADTFIKNLETVVTTVSNLVSGVEKAITTLGNLKTALGSNPVESAIGGLFGYGGPPRPGAGGPMPYSSLAYPERGGAPTQQSTGLGGLSGTVQFLIPVYVDGQKVDERTQEMSMETFVQALRRGNRT